MCRNITWCALVLLSDVVCFPNDTVGGAARVGNGSVIYNDTVMYTCPENQAFLFTGLTSPLSTCQSNGTMTSIGFCEGTSCWLWRRKLIFSTFFSEVFWILFCLFVVMQICYNLQVTVCRRHGHCLSVSEGHLEDLWSDSALSQVALFRLASDWAFYVSTITRTRCQTVALHLTTDCLT